MDSVKHYFCSLAFGDSLISLSQLEDLPQSPHWQVLGTAVTTQVSTILRSPMPVIELLGDKPAYNSIKERGVVAAVQDFLTVCAALRRVTEPGDTVVFERRDLRNTLVLGQSRFAEYPHRTSSVYADRQELVRRVFGRSRPWRAASPPMAHVRTVVVNPSARYRRRWLSHRVVTTLLAETRRRGWRLLMIDPQEQYRELEGELAGYLPRPALAEAVACLRQADLYIGPDSFFIHLAYYFGIPHFGFFFPDHLDFLPPGSHEVGAWCTFEQASERQELASALDAYLSNA